MEYILSKYNYFKEFSNAIVCVNLYVKILFCIEKSKFEKLLCHKGDLEVLKIEDPIFFSAMFKLGIIQEKYDDHAVKDILLLNNRKLSFLSNSYRLTINPTLNCNFNCWYCYEDHSIKVMTPDTMSNIVKYVNNVVENCKLNYFYLDWFGGEPLLCYNSVMRQLAFDIKSICVDNNIAFESGITTNGSLINKDIISFFKEVNMQSLQITLDGSKDVHNKTRFNAKHPNSYDRIVDNIILVATELKPENLALRINYTVDTMNTIYEIIDSFPQSIRSCITVLFQQVWQDREINDIAIVDLENMKNDFENSGFKVDKEILNTRGYTCYADLYNQAVINYDGRVFKCTARNFESEKEDGVLTDNGEIVWHKEILSRKISNATFQNDKCMNCEFLPVCYAPCSQKVFVCKNNADFDKYCFYDGIKETLDYISYEFYKSGNKLRYILDYR